METLAPPVRRRRLRWYSIVALVVALAAVAFVVWSGSDFALVGKSGIVTVVKHPTCANPDAVTFHGYVWEAKTFAPADWSLGPHVGRFTVGSPSTKAKFVSTDDHVTIEFARLPKGAFSGLGCAIR